MLETSRMLGKIRGNASDLESLASASSQQKRETGIRADQRLIKALQKLNHLYKLPASELIGSEFDGSRWHLSSGGNTFAEISELPSFREIFEVIRKRAAKLNESHPEFFDRTVAANHTEIEDLIDKFDPPDLIQALRLINANWISGDRSEMSLKYAGNCLAKLNAQKVDLLEVGDELSSDALYLVAISSVIENSPQVEAQYWLALSMGYSEEARELSSLQKSTKVGSQLANGKQIASSDSNNSNSNGNGTGSKAGEDRKTIFVRLNNLKSTDLKEWIAAAKTLGRDHSMTLALLSKFASVCQQSDQPAAANELLATCINSLTKGAKLAECPDFSKLNWSYKAYQSSADWGLGNIAEQFDERLDAFDFEEGGLIGREIPLSYYSSCFYSGVSMMADYYVQNSMETANTTQFAKSLRTSRKTYASLMERWFLTRLALKRGTVSTRDLRAETVSLSSISSEAILAMWCDSTYDPSDRGDANEKLVLSVTDSRPQTRNKLKRLERFRFLNPEKANRLEKAESEENPPLITLNELANWCKQHEWAKLKSALRLAPETVAQFLQELNDLDERGISLPANLDQIYRNLSQEQNDWHVLAQYATYLRRKKNYTLLLEITNKWIQQGGDSPEHLLQVQRLVCESLCAQGKFDDSLKFIDRCAGKNDPVLLAMRIKALLLLKQTKSAKQWALQFLEDHPESKAAVLAAAEALWASGDYDKAAVVLSKASSTFGEFGWQTQVGPVFVSIFDNNRKTINAAIESLQSQGLSGPYDVGRLADAEYKSGHPEAACMIAERLLQAHSDAQPELIAAVFRFKKKWQGAPSAIAWMMKNSTPSQRLQMSDYAFAAGEPELLWELNSDLPHNAASERLWLLRAAYYLCDPETSAKHEHELFKYYREAPDSLNKKLGLNLLTGSDSNQLFEKKLTEEELCRCAFFAGWKAMLDKKIEYKSIEHYRVALAKSVGNMPESDWSLDWLLRLCSALESARTRREITGERIDSYTVSKLNENVPWSPGNVHVTARFIGVQKKR